MEYAPNKQFNLLNGTRRQIYLDDSTGRHIDIFIGDFEMCHKLPLNSRLHLDPVTVPLAELLLSKAQIVELNRKDALDIASLLLYNELGEDDDGKINLRRIAQLCGDDWGVIQNDFDQLEPRPGDHWGTRCESHARRTPTYIGGCTKNPEHFRRNAKVAGLAAAR